MSETRSKLTTPHVVASDLDGTLLRSDGTLSARTRDAITAVEARGITVIFVTARPPRWLDDLADAVGPHGIALCGNGAFVYDVTSRAVVEEHPLETSLVLRLAADLRAVLPTIAFAVERADGGGRESLYEGERQLRDDAPVGPIEQLVTSPVGKLLARCDGVDPAEFHAIVAETVAGRATLAYSGAVGLAEITGRGVTKAAVLTRWCATRGIDPADVWAFGDMPNDLPMLTWAGTSFAVENAHPDVLDAAEYVCPINDEDGVAQMLELLSPEEAR